MRCPDADRDVFDSPAVFTVCTILMLVCWLWLNSGLFQLLRLKIPIVVQSGLVRF